MLYPIAPGAGVFALLDLCSERFLLIFCIYLLTVVATSIARANWRLSRRYAKSSRRTLYM